MHSLKVLEDEMKVRGFSMKTIKAYLHFNLRFLRWIGKSADEVSRKDTEEYLIMLYDRGVKGTSRHLIVAALKFYYEGILKRRFNLKYPKKENTLPEVLSKGEILGMLASLSNEKHKLMLKLMYGSGLRLGELLNARIDDFDLERKTFHVRLGKGGKDRIVNLSENFIVDFRRFIGKRDIAFDEGRFRVNGFRNNNPENNGFLFTGGNGKKLSQRTVQNIVKTALRRAGIRKKAHPHTFRVSYATHLIENGTEISYIQRLLGHARRETTERYLRINPDSIRNVRSPLDSG
ncbi:tyrosine-type recombinase/integrase [Candidatus Woesearchaeota archaeon]|nr:tyrosine-type recombinase/integrase [Candidatus Woesearchaeota archaeon]